MTLGDLEALAGAARAMRQLAGAANTDEARRPYSDPRIDPVPESEWGKLVDNYLGGEIGAHCAAWTPAVAESVADVLDVVGQGYEDAVRTPECLRCGSYCASHELKPYHVECGLSVENCPCLTPYLRLAERFLGAGVFVGVSTGRQNT